MKHASLFSGIGGFDLAAEWMGWENVFHCEWMEFPRKVLDYYWPDADSYVDICKTDFKKYANQIDILTGGFPCQPFSMAGKRKGTEDERYLWGEMLRAVQEIKPKYVIAENVFGITNIDGGMVFEQVCLDLEAEGYEVQPFVIPAAAKNAPHRRDRVWFIAQYTNCERLHNRKIETGRRGNWKFISTSSQWKINQTRKDATHTECSGGVQISKDIQPKQSNRFKFVRLGRKRNVTNSDSCRQQTLNNKKPILGQEDRAETFGGDSFKSIYREERWENFPTQSPICGGDDGIPTKLDGITFPKWRAESIKGYGNAIVPQVALEIFKVIENIDCNLSK